MNLSNSNRRSFLKKGGLVISASLLTGNNDIFAGNADKEEEVTPTEDLMREHGVLNRILLIYEECISRIKNGKDFSPEFLTKSALIVREFIEDYHEKQEEDYLFPRFEKAGKLTDLVKTLRIQHQAGRSITDKVKSLSEKGLKTKEDKNQVSVELEMFIRFYRPHEAREDTVLFPALRSIISGNEFDSLGEEFEKNEHKKLGQDGFNMFVNKVADIEKHLDIFDLSNFTPQ